MTAITCMLRNGFYTSTTAVLHELGEFFYTLDASIQVAFGVTCIACNKPFILTIISIYKPVRYKKMRVAMSSCSIYFLHTEKACLLFVFCCVVINFVRNLYLPVIECFDNFALTCLDLLVL